MYVTENRILPDDLKTLVNNFSSNQIVFNYKKLTMETLEQGVKYVQN